MKTFRIAVWEEQGGYATIIANTKKEAENKVRRHLENYGFDPMQEKIEFETTHRDCNLL